MLFTDGRNTYGNKRPIPNGSLLYCINSSCNADIKAMNQIAGTSGGKVIDLTKISLGSAIDVSNKAENWLLNISSSGGKIITHQSLPMKLNESILIS